ncbi:hypothetical protein E0Z10_g1364 [Xylaria hypoxylon]|uniref:Uncharacterized protein n=1 Tax=Xylaria hypoxylon TaxID=37992 RepID=A0A4Z0ZEZ2_9PEZI|nr:hypothetical protein E0Z10_g1364 [Xylaria hypoxylon]
MSSQPSGGTLRPTFHGFIGSTMDALILFEACLSGLITHVARRPHDRERAIVIQSGNVFIYEEHSSGIKRWTDGVPWSPSRILGNFLLYRELDKPFQPGEKKRAMKRNKTDGGILKHSPTHRSNSIGAFGSGASALPTTMANMDNSINMNDVERAYIGSLVDSYQFKENGLIKKTISVQFNGVSHHLVSYYSLDDIKGRRLKTVSETPELSGVVPRRTLMSSTNFRSPVDDNELAVDPGRTYVMTPTAMGYMRMDGLQNRSLSIPPAQPYHSPAWVGTQHYGHSPPSYLSQAMQPTATTYAQHLVPSYTYDTAYGQSRPASYDSMMQNRRHSVVPSTNGTSQLGYSPALLANGSGLSSHGISANAYGDMFHASAANAAAESTSTGSTGGYSAAGTISQTNGTHNIGNSVSHTTAGFDDHLSNGYGSSMSRMAMNEYGDTLQDSAGPNFSSTSTSTTPTNLPMGVDHSELPLVEHGWNTAGQIVPKREGGDQW